MFPESDDTIRRLEHQKNVWRGIAIGLGATLVLLMVLGLGGLFLAKQSHLRAARAEEAMMRALVVQEREAAEAARRAAEKRKAKQ
jgi:hypothetical protein